MEALYCISSHGNPQAQDAFTGLDFTYPQALQLEGTFPVDTVVLILNFKWKIKRKMAMLLASDSTSWLQSILP